MSDDLAALLNQNAVITVDNLIAVLRQCDEEIARLRKKIRLLSKQQRRTRGGTLLERREIGKEHTRIIDLYYEKMRQGQRPKLVALADEFCVNYDSLRASKVKYDAAWREEKDGK